MNIKKISFQKLVIQTLFCLVLLALPFSGQTPAASAATGQTGEQAGSTAQQPLETLLNPDGSLKLDSGFSGSLDPSGWNLRLNADGEPTFVQKAASGMGDLWKQPFALNTSPVMADDLTRISAVTISGTDVYVGGYFNRMGNVLASCIAKWNSATSEWETLGGGISGPVYAIAVYGDYVYAGGDFLQTSGGLRAEGIARWHRISQRWFAMGSGLIGWGNISPMVRAIVIDGGGTVYAGGHFSQALPGAPEANNLAKWANGTWYSIAQSMGGPNASSAWVHALAIGDKLYAGGSFNQVGSSAVAATNIAAWDGANWSPLGNGVSGTVFAIGTYGNQVYAGGDITQAGGTPVNGIARWDYATAQWSSMSSGLVGWNGDYAHVRTITVDSNGIVFVGGNFSQALPGAPEANNLAFYYAPTGTWYSIAQSMGGPDASSAWVYSVGLGDKLYAGGTFVRVGSNIVMVKNIAAWNGVTWSALGSQIP